MTSDANNIHNNLRILYEYAKLGELYSKAPSCNTCYRKSCEYKPAPGEIVRPNCPLYVENNGSSQEEDE